MKTVPIVDARVLLCTFGQYFFCFGRTYGIELRVLTLLWSYGKILI